MLRRKKTITAAIGVLLLAGVIYGAASLSSPRRAAENDRSRAYDVGEQTDGLYDDAMAALRSGDTTSGREMLLAAARLAPDDARVGRALAALPPAAPSGPAPKPAGADAPATAPAGDGDPGAPGGGSGERTPPPPASALALLPAALASFSPGAPSIDAEEIALSLDPAPEMAPRVAHGLLAVHGMKDPAAASAFVEREGASAYPRDVRKLSVSGLPARFGTDGRRLACLSFAWGRFAVEIVLTVERAAPATLEPIALQVAEEIPGL